MTSVGTKPGQAANTPGGDYADPGYQPDKLKRYPLDTLEHVQAAARYFAKSSNRQRYTAGQRAHIDAAINAAKRRFGVDPASYRDHINNT